MSSQIACPACHRAIYLPDDQPGRGFHCAYCGTNLISADGGRAAVQPQHFAGQAGNPFSEDPNPGWAAPDPYDAPGYYPGGFYAPSLMQRNVALARAGPPAVLLMIVGSVFVVAGASVAVLMLFEEMRQDEVGAVVALVVATLALALGLLFGLAGWQLRRLRSYGVVLAATILLLLAGLATCPLLALPGIWPLVVLLDPGVRANFDKKAAVGQ